MRVFIMIRLVLGLFGMDLYEIYWWFAFSLTISLSNILTINLIRWKDIKIYQ